jgi:hypothetical protein
MGRQTPRPAVAALLLLLAAAGCSSGGGVSEQTQIEGDVSQLMELMAALVAGLDPFAAAAPAVVSPGGGGSCTDVSGGNCNAGGNVEQCPTGGLDVNVVFNNCMATLPQVAISIDGILTYSPSQDWPSGARDIVATTPDANWAYDMTFDRTESVQVQAHDLIGGTDANCVGNLVTFAAECEIVETPN